MRLAGIWMKRGWMGDLYIGVLTDSEWRQHYWRRSVFPRSCVFRKTPKANWMFANLNVMEPFRMMKWEIHSTTYAMLNLDGGGCWLAGAGILVKLGRYAQLILDGWINAEVMQSTAETGRELRAMNAMDLEQSVTRCSEKVSILLNVGERNETLKWRIFNMTIFDFYI